MGYNNSMSLLENFFNTETNVAIPKKDLEALILQLLGLLKNDMTPVIRFSNGVEFDLSKNSVTLNNPTHIHSTETIRISTDKHLILNSGGTQVPGKPEGYPYGIWENTELDENGDPILLDEPVTFFKSIPYGHKPVNLK